MIIKNNFQEISPALISSRGVAKSSGFCGGLQAALVLMPAMPYTMRVANLKKSWNAIARPYGRRYRIASNTVHYGPLCPGEDKLHLLGNMAGLRALDLGCGGGHNSIALSRLGAEVTAVDFSEEQIAAARNLAAKGGFDATFMVGDIGELSALEDGSFDLVISVCAISFVKDENRVFAEAHRLLRPGGRLILSDMHPVQYILDENPKGVAFNNSYPFDPFRMRWRWEFDGDHRGAPIDVNFEHYVRSVPHYCNALIDSGFSISRILEPKPTSRTPHIGFSREILQEYPYIAKHLPITFIIGASREP